MTMDPRNRKMAMDPLVDRLVGIHNQIKDSLVGFQQVVIKRWMVSRGPFSRVQV